MCVVSFVSYTEMAYCDAPASSGGLVMIYHKLTIYLCLSMPSFYEINLSRNFLIARLELIDKFCK